MMLKIGTESPQEKDIYFIFKYLWLFVIVPKSVQLAGFALIALCGIVKNGGKVIVPKIVQPFLAYSLLHLLSIVINMAFGKHEMSRIFAALNTDFIWIISIVLFSLAYQKRKQINMNKIGKYCVANILILFALFLASVFFNIETVNFLLFKGILLENDWTSSGAQLRFRGFMEYATLVGLFVVMLFPIALKYIVEIRKKTITGLFFIILAYVPIYACASRTGILIGLLVCLLGTYYVVAQMNVMNTQKTPICVCAIMLVVVLAAINFRTIYEEIYNVVMMRGNSTSMRSIIYQTSISKVLDQSPLIGLGIKDLISGYPLGSHNTYVGVFYKTGIIGCMFFLWGLYLMIREGWRRKKQTKDSFTFFCRILFWAMLATEDLDGANWLIAMFFVSEALSLAFVDHQISTQKHSACGSGLGSD